MKTLAEKLKEKLCDDIRDETRKKYKKGCGCGACLTIDIMLSEFADELRKQKGIYAYGIEIADRIFREEKESRGINYKEVENARQRWKGTESKVMET